MAAEVLPVPGIKDLRIAAVTPRRLREEARVATEVRRRRIPATRDRPGANVIKLFTAVSYEFL